MTLQTPVIEQPEQTGFQRQISGHITADDYILATHLFYKRQRQSQYLCFSLILAIGLGLCLLDFTTLRTQIATFGFIMTFSIIAYHRHVVPDRIRRLHQQRKAFADLITFSWDTSSFTASSVQGHGSMPWADFVRYKEDQAVILLYHDDSLYTLVPKRWFQDTAQLNDFRQQLQQVSR
ncbi:YcxB family protein [Leeia sp.]|uniref:YcxB family protein n=1 Tax=Leeia sp. TaxID=2884678 RepID=UPI0035B286E2